MKPLLSEIQFKDVLGHFEASGLSVVNTDDAESREIYMLDVGALLENAGGSNMFGDEEELNLYHVTQNEITGYDTFSDMVVCAKSSESAKLIHPREGSKLLKKTECCPEWVGEDQLDVLKVELIGIANSEQEEGVVCSSYHAG